VVVLGGVLEELATVMVVLSEEEVPPGPVATAVYVVVVIGVTVSVPLLPARVYDVLLVPVTTTWLAFVAVTVKVADCPSTIDAELGVMPTVSAEVGPWGELLLLLLMPAHPMKTNGSKRVKNSPTPQRLRGTRGLISLSLVPPVARCPLPVTRSNLPGDGKRKTGNGKRSSNGPNVHASAHD
jgi:hypothetical protein